MGETQALENCELLDQALSTATTLVPLKALKPHFLQYLFTKAQVRVLFRGQTLAEASGYDQKHIYLLHGQVELEYSDGQRETVNGADTPFPLAYLKARRYKAVARSDCSVLIIDSGELDRILTWNQAAQFLAAEIAVERNYDEDQAWMQTLLNSNLFFKVPPVNVEQIFSRLTPMIVLNRDAIIRQGEIGDCCYFIKEGSARVTRHWDMGTVDSEPRSEHLADIGVGRCFGEDALLYETVRNANVAMTSDGVLMRLEKNHFMLLLREPDVRQISRQALDDSDAPVLVDVRTEEEYAAGHLKAAANIPLNLLSLKKRLLDKGRPCVFYCDTGRRSRAAAYLLGREGYQTAALEGGLQASADARNDLLTSPDYILRGGLAVPADEPRVAVGVR